MFHSSPSPLSSCAHTGCAKKGEYKAPAKAQSFTTRPLYLWFCLEHIREYNAKWNALAGCTPQEIEAHIKWTTVWERPTWPLGKGPFSRRKQNPPPSSKEKQLPPDIEQALAVMGLTPPSSLAAVKKRYRTLAKEVHPDLNRGKADTAAQFHALGSAYAKLQKHYDGGQDRSNRK